MLPFFGIGPLLPHWCYYALETAPAWRKWRLGPRASAPSAPPVSVASWYGGMVALRSTRLRSQRRCGCMGFASNDGGNTNRRESNEAAKRLRNETTMCRVVTTSANWVLNHETTNRMLQVCNKVNVGFVYDGWDSCTSHEWQRMRTDICETYRDGCDSRLTTSMPYYLVIFR